MECGVCSKESFVYVTRIIFARRKQVCACAHKIMKRVHYMLTFYRPIQSSFTSWQQASTIGLFIARPTDPVDCGHCQLINCINWSNYTPAPLPQSHFSPAAVTQRSLADERQVLAPALHWCDLYLITAQQREWANATVDKIVAGGARKSWFRSDSISS